MLSCLFIFFFKNPPQENSPLHLVFPLTAACVTQSAHLSQFLRRPLKLCWYVVVISKVCDGSAGQLFRSWSKCVHIRQGVFYTCDRCGTALTAVETHPYRRLFSKRIFSKLQITITALVMWNHLAVGIYFFSPCITNFKKLCNSIIVWGFFCRCLFIYFYFFAAAAVFTIADRKKKRNTDWRLQLLRGELCPHAACRSFTVSAIPTWKRGHLLHATTRKMLVSSSIPSTHKQFCLFMPLEHGAAQCDHKPKDCIKYEEYRFLHHYTHTSKEELYRIRKANYLQHQ